MLMNQNYLGSSNLIERHWLLTIPILKMDPNNDILDWHPKKQDIIDIISNLYRMSIKQLHLSILFLTNRFLPYF